MLGTAKLLSRILENATQYVTWVMESTRSKQLMSELLFVRAISVQLLMGSSFITRKFLIEPALHETILTKFIN